MNIADRAANGRSGDVPREPASFVLYRIIGNDLAPRHKPGQSRDNIRFILENEPVLDRCTKRWVVNRILDKREESDVLALLDAYDQDYVHIPFVTEAYRKIGWMLDGLPRGLSANPDLGTDNPRHTERVYVAICSLRNNYITNNNGARNAALADGRHRAKWVLPWDGNCF